MLSVLLGTTAGRLVHAHEEKTFITHMRETNRLYTGPDYHLRLGIFLTHHHFVHEFNALGRSFTLRLTSLATLTPAEYRSLLRTKRSPPKRSPPSRLDGNFPPSVDWRDSGVVLGVVDLGDCAADWAWGAAVTVASGNAILSGNLSNLSIQNMIDCDNNGSGCDGGSTRGALDYIIGAQYGWMTIDALYPFTGHSGTCSWDQASMPVARVCAYEWQCAGSELQLMQSVGELGPVACNIDASHRTFQLYNGGVYDEPGCSSDNLDHEIVVIGYGADHEVEYWIAQNNWGLAWGEAGYIRMVRNKGNQCGIASDCVVPICCQ
jgi:cathepsin L